MKIESKTLYRQWRGLMACSPERCDPAWVDLSVVRTSDNDLIDKISRFQKKPKGRARFGYEWFIEDMAELRAQSASEISPHSGGQFLALRYQHPVGDDLDPLFYDFQIVPKLSRCSGAYAYVDGMTYLNAVAIAGGFTYRARKGTVYVVRGDDAERDEIKLDINDKVQPGDIIRIAERLF